MVVIQLLNVLLLLIPMVSSGQVGAKPYKYLTDLLEIDTIVQVGKFTNNEFRRKMFAANDGVRILHYESDRPPYLRGWSCKGDVLPQLTLECLDAPDSVIAPRNVADVSVYAEQVALMGDSVVVVLNHNDLKHCRSAQLFRLPQAFDRCCIINDSIIAVWRWRYASAQPLVNCHVVGLVNRHTGEVRTVSLPFAEGLLLSFESSFSCIVSLRQYIVAVDPMNGDIWALNAASTASTFELLESGTFRSSSKELYANPPDEPTARDVSSLLKRLSDNELEDAQVLKSVHQISDSILLVVKSPYRAREKKRGIDSVDAYVLSHGRLESVARSLTLGYLESDVPCTRDIFPVSISDGRIRTIGDRLVNLTLQVPIDECCNGVIPLSDYGKCVAAKLEDYEDLPLMLVSYRLRYRKP